MELDEEVLYRPHKTFKENLQRQYREEAERYFNGLVEKAATDSEANKLHVKDYREQLGKVNKAKKKLSSAKGWRIFFIVFLIIMAIASIGFFVLFGQNASNFVPLIVAIVCLVGVAGSIFGIVMLSKKAKNVSSVLAELEEELARRKALCDQDMASLNALFDWNSK